MEGGLHTMVETGTVHIALSCWMHEMFHCVDV